jgi:glutamyl-tRNA synthetase
MHLGNARTALLAWLHSRARGGRMILRIEDLDPQRCKPAFERLLLHDLRWLGLDWDEGPDVGGPHAPYRQSERTAVYEAALARLDTYPCTCSRKELRETAMAPHAAEPVYPGTCRDGPKAPGRPASVRWRVPTGAAGVIAWHDEWRGPAVEDVAQTVGDFVLRRGDGAWAYQLAVVVDDGAMGVTHVLRGADLTGSTARQIALQCALGLATPRYAHAPLVVGDDGSKLNKRHGLPGVAALREAGEDPRAVVAALARSIGLVDARVDRVSPSELVPVFDEAAVARRASAGA